MTSCWHWPGGRNQLAVSVGRRDRLPQELGTRVFAPAEQEYEVVGGLTSPHDVLKPIRSRPFRLPNVLGVRRRDHRTCRRTAHRPGPFLYGLPPRLDCCIGAVREWVA